MSVRYNTNPRLLSYSISEDLPLSGQQVPWFVRFGYPAHARCGNMPRSWVHYLRRPDLLGLVSRDPDSVEGDLSQFYKGSCVLETLDLSAIHLASFSSENSVSFTTTHGADLSGTPCRTEGEGRPESSCLSRGLVEIILQPFQADLVSAPVARSSSAPGGSFIPGFGIPKSWVPDLVLQLLSTPTTGFLGLVSSLDPVGNILPVFELPKTWVPVLVIQSVPTPMPSTESLRLISSGSDFGSLVLIFGSSLCACLQDSSIPSRVPIWSKAGGRRWHQRLAIRRRQLRGLFLEAVSPPALSASTRPIPKQISDSAFSGWVPVTLSTCSSLHDENGFPYKE